MARSDSGTGLAIHHAAVTNGSDEPGAIRPPHLIGRQLAGAFLMVWLIAASLSGIHLWLLAQVNDDLAQMRRDEIAIKDSLGLAAAVREQYMRAAHCIIRGDMVELPRYEERVAEVRDTARTLEARVPASERARLSRVAIASAELDGVFRDHMIPAVLRRDADTVRRLHTSLALISSRATADADLVARSVEESMGEAHEDAMKAADLTFVAAIVGLIALAIVASASALRLRAAVLRPLAALTRAAQRLGTGALDTRVGRIGSGELAVLADAFDTMAKQLREHEQRVVATERMAAIGQLAAGVAHEINNPIGVIRGYLRTMIRDAPAELRPELEILDEEASACERIAEDLLNYARAGELVLEKVPIDALLRQTVERFAESKDGRDRSVDVEVDAEPAELDVDAVRIRQVVQNLLRNATQASTPEAEVSVRGRREPGGYRVTVTDRGAGVPEKLRGRVFEPFFTSRPAGSGLGLAVCKGIVEAHGGTIEVRGAEERGTEVSVTLPLAAQIEEVPHA
jgi:two-component system, NtrC family, sensor kinase